MAENKIVIYKSGELKLDVHLSEKTVWLNLNQLVEIFNSTKSNVSEHLKHIFKEEDIDEDQTVRFFRTLASNNKSYNIKYYNLDVIILLAMRINSPIARSFRKWAREILKEYSIEGSAINKERCLRCENNYLKLQEKIYELEQNQKHEITFQKGEQLQGYLSIKRFLETARQSIYIIDDYFDHSFDDVLKDIGVTTTIFTDSDNIIESNEIYEVHKSKKCHDRFIFVDGVGYQLGCSLKDIGNSFTIATKLNSITLSDILKIIK